MTRESANLLDPALDFMSLLWSIEHGLQSTSKRMGATLGVTGPQRLVLRIVSRAPGMSAGELADVMRLHPSTVTGVLQRLVDKKLLIRRTHPDDSRRARLYVTKRAARLTRPLGGTVEAAVSKALGRVAVAHVHHARGVLTAIATALEEGNGG